LKITTINLFQFCNPRYSYYSKKEKFTIDEWNKKILWLKTKLKNLNSDFIAFQEVFCDDILEDLCKSCGYEYFATVDKAFLDKNIYKTCIVAVASKNKFIDISTPSISKDFEFSRKPIKVKIKIENKELLIYNVHLKSNRLNEFEHKFTINNTFKEKYEKNYTNIKNKTSALHQRFREIIHLSSDINKNLKENKNIIVLGDFNDKLHSFCLDALKSKDYLNDIINDNKIKDDYKFELKDAFDLTNLKKRKYTSYFMSEGNIIDFILVSENIKNIKSYEVDDYHLKDNKNGSLLNSDHAIVSCDIELK